MAKWIGSAQVFLESNRGRLLPRCQYTVLIRKADWARGGKTLTVPLELKKDLRSTASDADLQKEFDLELRIRELLSDLHDSVHEIRETRGQLRTVRNRLEDPRYKSIVDSAEAIDKKMTQIEEQLLQVNAKSSESTLNYPVLIDEQLHGLMFSVEGDYAPTQQQVAAFDALRPQSEALVAQWRTTRSTDVPALNDMMKKEAVPAIYLAAPTPETKTQQAGGGGK